VLVPDHEIRRLCKHHAMVMPFDEDLLNPASLDVTMGNRIMIEVPETPELQVVDILGHTADDPYLIQPGEFFLAETQEIFNLPNHIGAQFVLKSSRAREGWDHAEAGWCDPGWYGSRLTMEICNQRRLHPARYLARHEVRANEVSAGQWHRRTQLRGGWPLQRRPGRYGLQGIASGAMRSRWILMGASAG